MGRSRHHHPVRVLLRLPSPDPGQWTHDRFGSRPWGLPALQRESHFASTLEVHRSRPSQLDVVPVLIIVGRSPMRSQLIALGTGSVACLAYGITRGLGYGLPPYSVIYAAAFGVIAGLLVYGLFAIKTRWLFRAVRRGRRFSRVGLWGHRVRAQSTYSAVSDSCDGTTGSALAPRAPALPRLPALPRTPTPQRIPTAPSAVGEVLATS